MLPNIGLGELTVIVLIALVVFGPKRLPEMMRAAGKALGSLQRESSKAMQELRDATNVVGDLGAPPDLGAYAVPDSVPEAATATAVADPASPQQLAPEPARPRPARPRAARPKSAAKRPAAKTSKPAAKTSKRAASKSPARRPPPVTEPIEDT